MLQPTGHTPRPAFLSGPRTFVLALIMLFILIKPSLTCFLALGVLFLFPTSSAGKLRAKAGGTMVACAAAGA
jgi:hypothetical protein